MIIWLLAVVLLAVVATTGYYQGALRAAFSLVGLVLGAALAWPLSPLVRPLFPALTLTNPMWGFYLAPVVVFVAVVIVFKVAALSVHQKVESHYKYHDSDTRRLMWERLNQRLGLCVGLVNGAVYLLLVAMVIQVMGYVTVQLAHSDADPTTIKVLNRAAEDLQNSGFTKTLAPFDPMPESYYEAVDVIGDVRNNPLLVSRLARYPAFLGLSERQDFQDLGNDTEFNQMWNEQARIGDLLNYFRVQAILKNAEIMAEIQRVRGDLKDLKQFVETGTTTKYGGEKILGRWGFNVAATMTLVKKAKPNLGPVEVSRLRKTLLARMSRAMLTATLDNRIILKTGGVTVPLEVAAKGTWKKISDEQYEFTLDKAGQTLNPSARIEGNKISFPGDGDLPWSFEKEL
ncbi:MAG TPA: CvpA family protein [Candidatus Eisenbacteria bacterium]|nr:CvpA family protein [Candidatus Eisenbacteria bacterium]